MRIIESLIRAVAQDTDSVTILKEKADMGLTEFVAKHKLIQSKLVAMQASGRMSEE